MFFQKASDPVAEVTVAEVTAVVEIIADHLQDQPEAVPRRQGLTAVQHGQPPERLGQAPAEATAVVPLAHPDRVQHGQAVRYDKNRLR